MARWCGGSVPLSHGVAAAGVAEASRFRMVWRRRLTVASDGSRRRHWTEDSRALPACEGGDAAATPRPQAGRTAGPPQKSFLPFAIIETATYIK